ncbi:MAG: hypothetical protein ACN6O8_25755 [Achromobacter sp.]|uniref:hypothetical protein n=1 Tax=Achromobacter sp. TaxID=134375 RepID=UPI003D050E7E
MAQNPAPMNRSALTLPRLLAARLLWYTGVAVLAVTALASQTPFSVAAVLWAIAVYIPLSMLALPLQAWLVLRRADRQPPTAPAPSWPCWLAAATGIALLALYHLRPWLVLAECGVLALLIAVDQALARREATRLLAHAAMRRPG